MPTPVTLTDTEKAYLAEILGTDSTEYVADELLRITSAQETVLKANIAEWITVRSEDASISGEVNFSYSDSRRRIQKRVCDMLDCWELLQASQGAGGNSGVTLIRA